MKNRFYFIAVCLFVVVTLTANDRALIVSKLKYVPTDLSASENSRLDANGRPCALLKVLTRDTLMHFDGMVVDKIKYKDGYLVYVSAGTNQLRITSSKEEPLILDFREYNIPSAKAKATYELTFLEANCDYEWIDMKRCQIIEGPKLKQYAVSLLTLPAGWRVNGLSFLEYLQRISKLFATEGDSWGEKYQCTILAEKDSPEEDDIFCYKLIISSYDNEVDAIFDAAIGHGGFENKIYIIKY